MKTTTEVNVTKQLAAAKKYALSFTDALRKAHKDVRIHIANKESDVYIRVSLTDKKGRARKFTYNYNEIKSLDLAENVAVHKENECDLK